MEWCPSIQPSQNCYKLGDDLVGQGPAARVWGLGLIPSTSIKARFGHMDLQSHCCRGRDRGIPEAQWPAAWPTWGESKQNTILRPCNMESKQSSGLEKGQDGMGLMTSWWMNKMTYCWAFRLLAVCGCYESRDKLPWVDIWLFP